MHSRELIVTEHYIYRSQRSCDQGYIFTRVCDSVHRGGLRAGRTPPGPGRHPLSPDQADPPRQGEPPPDQADTPPRTRQTPRAGRTPPDQADTPPRKQTPEYGLRAAGTHPTGMHSSFKMELLVSPRGN